jgi:DNA-binding XRE family transcriptional regulator
MSRAAALARARAIQGMSEEDCLVWFGVGRATIERVEAGEIVPSLELADKIDRYLQVCGGSIRSAALPGSPLEHGGDLTGAGDQAPASGAFLGDTR